MSVLRSWRPAQGRAVGRGALTHDPGMGSAPPGKPSTVVSFFCPRFRRAALASRDIRPSTRRGVGHEEGGGNFLRRQTRRAPAGPSPAAVGHGYCATDRSAAGWRSGSANRVEVAEPACHRAPRTCGASSPTVAIDNRSRSEPSGPSSDLFSRRRRPFLNPFTIRCQGHPGSRTGVPASSRRWPAGVAPGPGLMHLGGAEVRSRADRPPTVPVPPAQ